MLVYTREKIKHLLKIDFVRFCIVGGLGFVINFTILSLLAGVFRTPIYVAQLIGGEVALFSNFMLHNSWTYKHKKVSKSFKTLVLQFHATSWPAIVGSTLMVSAGVQILHLPRFEALVITSIIALLWNFVWSKFVIWRDISQKEIEEIAA